MGLWVASDCELGLTLSHGGGYPGYGSHVLLLPDHDAGIFAFANRTYAGPSAPVWDAAIVLSKAGFLRSALSRSAPNLPAPIVPSQRSTSRAVTMAADQLAMNFLMDRDAAGWARDLTKPRSRSATATRARPCLPPARYPASSSGAAPMAV